MALLRSVGMPCRLLGFTIHSELHTGAVPRSLQPLMPAQIIHSWVEISYDGAWRNLKGFILDRPYPTSIQQKLLALTGRFTGCVPATADLPPPSPSADDRVSCPARGREGRARSSITPSSGDKIRRQV